MPGDDHEWDNYTAYVYKDGVAILEGDNQTVRSDISIEEAFRKLMETRFKVRYPFEQSDCLDDSLELSGDLFLRFGKFVGKPDRLSFDTDLSFAEKSRNLIHGSLDAIQNDNESPSFGYKALDTYAAPYDGLHNIYVFVDGKLKLEGDAIYGYHRLSQKFPVFEMNLLDIPVRFSEGDVGDTSKELTFKGDILIMSRGLICFVDSLELEKDALGQYKLTPKSQSNAYAEYVSQNLTKSHQLNYFCLRPFHKP
jgi:hypothetical protein